LFIDEIGEMHPIQMNKLLKVLEDRRVMLDSAYYNENDTAIPKHIHDIFKNGLPADFRLVGATTRNPRDMPPAIRSRCMEVFFRPLTAEETARIGSGAARNAGFTLDERASRAVGEFSQSGRDAANIVQVAAGIARKEKRTGITADDIEWVARTGAYDPRNEQAVIGTSEIGKVNGLAVAGSIGLVMHIDATARPARGEQGVWQVTGIVEEEELSDGSRKMRRRSTASAAVQNVKTALARVGVDANAYDVHIDFPGGMPVDGPSAGVAMATAACSAILHVPVDGSIAMTGEMSILGEVLPVGGVPAKVRAAARGGARRVLVPRANWREDLTTHGPQVTPIDSLDQALRLCLQMSVEGVETGARTRLGGEGFLSAESKV
jgi:Lon-like ATP-dependent protease